VKRRDAVQVWADRWRELRAWGRPLEEVEIVIRERSQKIGTYSTGLAWPSRRRIVITAGADMPEALSVVLHELAHVAAPGRAHHGPQWRQIFARAVTEVTGVEVPVDQELRHQLVQRTAEDAVKHWWTASGNAFAWRLLSEKPLP
jgi:hypothetical protein